MRTHTHTQLETALCIPYLNFLFFVLLRIDHLETIQQLLTAVVKKIPLITAKSKTILNIWMHFFLKL